MVTREAVWALALPVVLFLGLLAFRRVRRRTDDYRQSATFKERVPNWLKQFEAITFCVSTALFVVLVVRSFFILRARFVGSTDEIDGADGVYLALGSILIAVPIAMLFTNFLSWLFPPSRKANLGAMQGLAISFWSTNRGLLWFGAASLPLGTVLLGVAAAAPWRW